jgi:transcriptional regulator with XRE-family HTH domain
LRSFRERAGLSVAEAAARLLSSPSKISRLEKAQRNATLRDVRDLSEAYGVPEEVQTQLMDLAQESRRRAWWQDSNLPPALETLIGMEGAARSIVEFQPLLVPGLLQTPEYARTVVDEFVSDASIRKALFESRMRRQEILHGDFPPGVNVVIDEAAIRRQVGGIDVMREQIDRLLDTYRTPQIAVRILPFSAGMHIGTLGGFIILQFDQQVSAVQEATLPGVVYIETLASGTYLDDPADVEEHLDAFARLARGALDREHSAEWLRLVRRELG